MQDDAARTFGPWVEKNLGLATELISCANDAPCGLPPAVAAELIEQDEIRRSSQHLEAWQRAGSCGATSLGRGRGQSSCSFASSGFWSAKENNITSVVACVAKCQGCLNCRYISFSRAKSHNGCSWYQRCDMAALIPPPSHGLDYSTVQVKSHAQNGHTGVGHAPRLP